MKIVLPDEVGVPPPGRWEPDHNRQTDCTAFHQLQVESGCSQPLITLSRTSTSFNDHPAIASGQSWESVERTSKTSSWRIKTSILMKYRYIIWYIHGNPSMQSMMSWKRSFPSLVLVIYLWVGWLLATPEGRKRTKLRREPRNNLSWIDKLMVIWSTIFIAIS